jgi:hypothetical protein
MSHKSWALIDAERDLWVESATFEPKDVPGSSGSWRVEKRTLRGGVRDGSNVVEVDNGAVRFTVLPDRGMGLWKLWHGDFELGWRSPARGPIHPKFVPLFEPGGLGWLSGFDELLVRCGLESNGAPEFDDKQRLRYPLHGRIANVPAHQVTLSVDGDSGEIAVTGVVDEARIYGSKLRLRSTISTRAGELRVRVVDEVTNLSGETGELELLYHVNFGVPLLEPGSSVVLPVKTLVPRNARAAEGVAKWDLYGPPQPGFTEQVYFFELAAREDGGTQALLRNAHGNQGASLHFNRRQLPCFTLWKSTQPVEDGYVTGLEPGVNFPNPRSYEKEQGRVAQLSPGATVRFELELELHPDAASVAAAEESVAAIQRGVEPKIYERPMPRWSADATG